MVHMHKISRVALVLTNLITVLTGLKAYVIFTVNWQGRRLMVLFVKFFTSDLPTVCREWN